MNRTNELNRGGDLKIPKDYSISLIRFISFVFIVSCHFLQFFGNELAWWFNVGVQMFLIISGYLYGVKYFDKNIDCFLFYKTRLLKILLPYYIVLLSVLLIHVVFIHDISKVNILMALVCNKTIPGGEHLWYISTILMCYILTPIIASLLCQSVRKRFFVVLVILFLSCYIFFGLFNQFYNPAWIACYILGFAFGVIEKRSFLSQKVIICIVFILSLQNILQVLNNYVFNLVDRNNSMYQSWSDCNHIWLGALIFLLVKILLSDKSIFNKRVFIKILDFSDKYSWYSGLRKAFNSAGKSPASAGGEL